MISKKQKIMNILLWCLVVLVFVFAIAGLFSCNTFGASVQKVKVEPRTMASTPGDRAVIAGSPLGGYSLLPADKYQISYVNRDGTLNIERLTEIVRGIANTGANAFREFPYWLQSAEEIPALSPFRVVSGEMHFQEKYFRNWRKLAEIVNAHNMTLIFSLYNNSSTRGSPGVYDPWRQFTGDRFYFYSAAAAPFMWKWESKIIETFQGLNVHYETINEASFKFPVTAAEIYIRLIRAGVPADKIHIGIDYLAKELDAGLGMKYKKFREKIVEELGNRYEKIIKAESWSPCHAVTLPRLKKHFGESPPLNGLRKTWWSGDGIMNPRQTEQQAFDIFYHALITQPNKADKFKTHFESVFGKEAEIDPLASLRGAVRAYEKYYGVSPGNKGKYPPKTEPPPVPVPGNEIFKKFQEIQAAIQKIESSYKKIEALYSEAKTEAMKAAAAYTKIKSLFQEIVFLMDSGK